MIINNLLICSVLILLIYTKMQNKNQRNKNIVKELKLNRHYLPNRNIQDKIYVFIQKIIQQHFKQAHSIDFTNIKISELKNGTQILMVEFYVIDQNKNAWNATQKKIQIFGKINNNGEFELIDINHSNSIDIGSIIPEISDIYLTPFSRKRDWEDNKINWDEYKKDWDVRWSNIPIHRDKKY